MPARLSSLAAALCLAVLLACAPRPAAAIRTLTSPGTAPSADPTVPVVALAALLAWALAAWLLLTVLLTAGTRLPGLAGRTAGALLRRAAPAALRRAVAVALGVSVGVAGLGAGTAGATPAGGPGTAVSSGALDRDLDLRSADRPGALPAGGLDWPGPGRTATTGTGATDAPHVVQPGDTLWDLAEASLPPTASDAQVATAWPAWWSANRDVIGDDPDVLLPGQHLTRPADAAD